MDFMAEEHTPSNAVEVYLNNEMEFITFKSVQKQQ